METAVLVSDSCPACKRLLDKLQNSGGLSRVRVINVDSVEGIELVKALGVGAIPECVLINTEGGERVARKCSEEEIKRLVVADGDVAASGA